MFIASREIRRSLGRFGLLTGAVALLVVLLLFFQAVAGALTLGLTGGIENNSADVIAYSDRARENPAASFLAPGVGDAVAELQGVATVSEVGRAALTVSDVGQATITESDEDATVIGLSDPSFGGPAELAEGRGLEAPGEAVARSSSLSLTIGVGDEVTIEGVELRVVGRADDAGFDVSPTFYTGFDDYATMVANRAGGPVDAPVSWLAIRAADGTDPAELAADITAADLPGTDVDALERSAAAAALPGVGQITQSFNILYLLLFIVVSIVTGVKVSFLKTTSGHG